MKPFSSTGFVSQTSADGTSWRASPRFVRYWGKCGRFLIVLRENVPTPFLDAHWQRPRHDPSIWRRQRHMVICKVVVTACEEVSGQSGFTAAAGGRNCPTPAVAGDRCAMDDRKPFDARMDLLENGLIYCSDELTCVARPQALDTIHHKRGVVLSSLSDFDAYVWKRVWRLEMFEKNWNEVDQIAEVRLQMQRPCFELCRSMSRPNAAWVPATNRFEPAPSIVWLIARSSRLPKAGLAIAIDE